MSKLVVLEFGEGDFEQGYPVTLQIAEEGKSVSTKITGRLPAAPQVEQSYTRWQSCYFHYRLSKSLMRLDHVDTEIQNVGDFIGDPIDECLEAGSELSYTLNEWLKSNSFAPITDKFFRKIKDHEKIRIILQTDDKLLWKLPWSLWEFLTEYQYAEIALSPRRYEPVSGGKSQRKIKILAILGNNLNNQSKKDQNDIDIQKDYNILKQQLPDANIEFLEQPKRKQLTDKLWEQGWDILFFAGHSKSERELNQGSIKINEDEWLSIEDLKLALNKAIKKGLSLAIFNSCDGLGLAAELSAMQIPQMIVMRESIPDVVAHEFLKHFLAAFARDRSLYLAVREARERLQGLEGEFPCASWLPVIFQNPACTPLTWIPRSYAPKLQTVIAASVAVAALMLGVRHLGWLQPLELKAYDQMMQQRPHEGIDPRILVVEVNKRDIDAQDKKERGEFSLSHTKLVQVINELNKHQPLVIGLDMYRDLSPLSDVKPTAYLEKLFENEKLFTVCKVNNTKEGNLVGTPPAPFIPLESLGFSDVVFDSAVNPDSKIKMIRRHLLFMNPDSSSRCTAHNSFNWQLAEYYLDTKKNIKPQQISNTELQLGEAHFKKLPSNAGGYQGLDNRGFQILLNYRYGKNFANSITITDLLRGAPPDSIRDKIILIGVTDSAVPDDFQTPYGTQIRGVFLHAQMVSQIISAALGERPLLGVWSWWADGLWICGWSFVGGLIVWCVWGAVPLVLTTVAAIFILYGSCFFLFMLGTWVPLVPSLLTLVSSGGILICYAIYKKSTINI
ncbi:MAG: CHASE2 domain-containing protein [Nostoc sp.]